MMEKQQKRNYELKIRYINIDNNLNHNTIYPQIETVSNLHICTFDLVRCGL